MKMSKIGLLGFGAMLFYCRQSGAMMPQKEVSLQDLWGRVMESAKKRNVREQENEFIKQNLGVKINQREENEQKKAEIKKRIAMLQILLESETNEDRIKSLLLLLLDYETDLSLLVYEDSELIEQALKKQKEMEKKE